MCCGSLRWPGKNHNAVHKDPRPHGYPGNYVENSSQEMVNSAVSTALSVEITCPTAEHVASRCLFAAVRHIEQSSNIKAFFSPKLLNLIVERFSYLTNKHQKNEGSKLQLVIIEVQPS